MGKQSIVVSAVSINSGGPLTVLKGVLSYLASSDLANKYEIIAIVHKKELFDIENVSYISIPQADNWILRLYYEYWEFNKISKKLNVYLWLSLQVASPTVKAEKQALYMHNPSPFYKWGRKDIRYGFRYILFAVFYKYIYRINIHKNKYLLVQQNWLRDEFSKMYNFAKSKIIVAYPKEERHITNTYVSGEGNKENNSNCTFLFPALPRIFKNYEIICEATRILNKRGVDNFEVLLTIDGTENKYSKNIVNKYSNISNIRFIGLIPHNKISEYYMKANCLIFPSKLETWGLPISEFSEYNKPMLIADLPYAHETASGSNLTDFFDPSDANELSIKMEKIINNDYSSLEPVPDLLLEQPFTNSWKEVFDTLLK